MGGPEGIRKAEIHHAESVNAFFNSSVEDVRNITNQVVRGREVIDDTNFRAVKALRELPSNAYFEVSFLAADPEETQDDELAAAEKVLQQLAAAGIVETSGPESNGKTFFIPRSVAWGIFISGPFEAGTEEPGQFNLELAIVSVDSNGVSGLGKTDVSLPLLNPNLKFSVI